jgi:hypothetical protein
MNLLIHKNRKRKLNITSLTRHAIYFVSMLRESFGWLSENQQTTFLIPSFSFVLFFKLAPANLNIFFIDFFANHCLICFISSSTAI